MFERFNEAARRTIFFARNEANRFGASQIQTEHLLLGIFADGPLSAHLLFPVSPEEIRLQLEQDQSQGQEILPDADPPLCDESKRVLQFAAEEADRLEDKNIGNEHLLLGLLLETKSYAAQLLVKKGVSLASVREQIERLRKDPSVLDSTIQGYIGRENRWRALGLPEGYAWPKLLFNPPSETLILQVSGATDWRPPRLYMKHKDAAKYTQIGNPDETTSYESPVTSLKQPLLGFNVMTWQKLDQVALGKWAVSGNWKELNVLDIKTGVLKHSIKKGELILPEGYNDSWISNIHAMSDDGGQIYVLSL
ncbi:MAG: ATP-dependent Clp protease ATP-binding subunit, partial [Acidobacteria bacterium]|nr:ATP-dependent Clp protease ATP-binding subunit [Acidobacteriota bacterium]